VETDLRTWTTLLQKLKDDVSAYSPSISIQEDQTQILIGKMSVLTTAAQHSRQIERFGESFGNIRIYNNGRLATHCGPFNGRALVRGIGEYSSGKHYIRFLFEKNSTEYINSFVIISKLMPIGGKFFNYDVYGWSTNDGIYCPGVEMAIDENFRDMKGQTTFEIEFQLDCDNRKISYVNQRTKNRREMNIDITKCPFPWQVRFYLFEVGSRVTLLP